MERGYQSGAVLLDKYRIESVLGRGGMGIVLRATHLHLGDEVALKILLPELMNQDVHARFLREAQAVVRLRGEHVARVSDVGVLLDGAPYMVMEYLRGTDLAGELKRRGALVPGEAVDFVLQACEALAEAHAHGIVHRDIKPSNLFLTVRPDGTPLVKVLDFGISKAPIGGGSLTRTDTVMGTPGYMSPEQMKAARDVDARTDIWALGIVLYECLNGYPPFQAEAFSAVVLKAATEPPPPLDPRLPRGLPDIVLRCLAKDREGRFASVADLALALAPFARDQRTASLVVDRARSMLGGPAAGTPPPVLAAPTDATTLQGSSIARTTSRRFRYTLAGVVSLFGAIGVILAIALSGRRGSAGPSASDDPPSVVVRDAAAERTAVTVSAPEPSAPPVALDASAAPAVPGGGGTDPSAAQRKAAQCQELDAHRDWQALHDCASELAALAAGDAAIQAKADEFRIRATRETASAITADKIAAALRDGNLRDAQRLLRSLGQDSVYWRIASDDFHAAEARALEDARRKAQALAAAHDCTGLRRFQAQAAATGTPGIAAAVAAIKCSDRAQAADKLVGTGDSPSPASPASPAKPACDTIHIDDVLGQAQTQFTAGFAKAALSLVVIALACKQDVKMYRLAATYACVAHDVASARLYYAKVPRQFQAAIAQRCQQENVSLVDPAAAEAPAPTAPTPASPAKTSTPAPAPASKVDCSTMKIDDTLTSAQNQFAAGFPKAALNLVTQALACKQDIRMFRMAALYACVAHDVASAKLYYVKVPQQFQPSIVQRCQQENINLP